MITKDYTRVGSMDVSESYSMHGNDGSPAPREVFEAKVGYDLWTRAK
jgi:hypothetical protein